MRLLTIAVLGLSLTAAQALAQTTPPAATTTGNNGRVFASTTCPHRVPCPDDAASTSTDYVALASTCIKQSFGFDSSNLLDDSGLDSNNCVALKPEVQQTGKGTVPRCCVNPLQDNSCVMICNFVTMH
jgi:hypothetical protein